MNKTVSAGGVVINKNSNVLVVSQQGASWSLPKGHVNEGEDFFVAAKREVEEESGINDLQLVKELGSYERPRLDDPTEIKTIHMFLFKTEQMDLKPVDPENPEARWIKVDEVEQLLTAEKDKEFFRSIKFALINKNG
ncbi:NUDIX domain-containing protein [Candidatus Woesebacteria bacterium]|nr:MAG: NUDIX domain-containing protein [Candidatus Woesebacteria bacterium]